MTDINDNNKFGGYIYKDEEGKYIYKLNDSREEIDRFNRDFEQYKERRKKAMKEELDKKLEILNKEDNFDTIYNVTVGEILISTKDAIFGMLDDLLLFKFDYETFTKNNRLFYIGIVMIFIVFLIYLYILFFNDKPKNVSPVHNYNFRIDKN